MVRNIKRKQTKLLVLTICCVCSGDVTGRTRYGGYGGYGAYGGGRGFGWGYGGFPFPGRRFGGCGGYGRGYGDGSPYGYNGMAEIM
jgi:hypothetical protein